MKPDTRVGLMGVGVGGLAANLADELSSELKKIGITEIICMEPDNQSSVTHISLQELAGLILVSCGDRESGRWVHMTDERGTHPVVVIIFEHEATKRLAGVVPIEPELMSELPASFLFMRDPLHEKVSDDFLFFPSQSRCPRAPKKLGSKASHHRS